MSPSVEHKEFNEGDIGSISVITVRLRDTEPFCPDKFEKLLKVCDKPGFGMYFLKYIVYADIMYIFPGHIPHNEAHSFFVENGVTNRPQSAGSVAIESDNPNDPFRTISDYSATLSNKGILMKGDSDKYKHEVINKMLGRFFKVT